MCLNAIYESRWRWWLLFLAAILVLAVGCYVGRLVARKAVVDMSEMPKHEIAVTDSATEKMKNIIEKAQTEKSKLPEVIKGVKDDIRRDVAGLSDDSIALRWNGLLGRYREDRAAAEGVRSDE